MTIKEAAEKLSIMFPDEGAFDVRLTLLRRDGKWNQVVSTWIDCQRVEAHSWEELIMRAERVIELRDRQAKPLEELEGV